MQIKCFTVNPFYENSYLVWDEDKTAAVIDPGFYTAMEADEFNGFIRHHDLKLKEVLLTHAHLDHIFGCEMIYGKYGLLPRMHDREMVLYSTANQLSAMYGVSVFDYPAAGEWLVENSGITVGRMAFKVLFTPGHSPGGLSLYCAEEGILFSGDALFEGSIGRTDLPGGDMDILLDSIRSQLFTLPKETRVFSGHGGVTTIGQEVLTNPFF